jgi:hypothetical protein
MGLAARLPVLPGLPLLAHRGHVLDRFPDGPQGAAVLGGSLDFGRGTQDATTWRINSAGAGEPLSHNPRTLPRRNAGRWPAQDWLNGRLLFSMPSAAALAQPSDEPSDHQHGQ